MSEYSFDVRPLCLKNLKKLDGKEYDRVERKMQEIIENPHHYKPLKAPMQRMRRVHVGHFVLIFSIDEQAKIVIFERYAHHDEAYK